jgi:hypothetical protein
MKGYLMSKHAISLILCCVALGPLGQTSSAEEKQTVDQEKIVQTVERMFSETDEKHWDNVQRLLADRVLMDFTSVNGGNPASLTPDQITKTWSGFDRISHHMKDFKVTESADQALVTYSGKTDHFLDNNMWVVEGSYETGLRKINGVWLITKHEIHLIKQYGDTDLPLKAREKQDKRTRIVPASELTWTDVMDSNGLPLGLRTVDVWGNAHQGAHGSLTKFPAGFAEPLHRHSNPIRVVVLSGIMRFVVDGVESVDLGPESYVSIAADVPHFARCAGTAPCEVLIEQDAAMDVKLGAK